MVRIFQVAKKMVTISILILAIAVVFAAIDHFFLMEKFRYFLSVIGKVSLITFFLGIILIVSVGVKEKLK